MKVAPASKPANAIAMTAIFVLMTHLVAQAASVQDYI
jgi:hypothetical protein